MKVLLLTTHVNIGGVGLYILNLAKGLKKRGIDCYVISSGGDLENHFKTAGIPVLNLNIKTKFEFNPKLIPAAFGLAKFAKENNIDVIHAHTRVAQVLAYIASKFSGISFVSTCHGFFKSDRLSRKIFPLWGKAVIAISEPVKKHLINDFNIDKDRVFLIRNGIDAEIYRDNLSDEQKRILKANLGLKNGPVIGSIGRLSPVKGYNYLLRAMKGLAEEIPGINLLLIGDGPSRDELKELSKKLGISGSVFFMGSRLDIEKFLFLMDIFILPSVQEGLGLSLLQAMASGRACIATSIGGITDIIRDGENGLLIPGRHSGAIAGAVKKLLSDKDLSFKLSRNAKRCLKEEFSADKMVDGIKGFYEEVIKKN